jgi:hypothetical protein
MYMLGIIRRTTGQFVYFQNIENYFFGCSPHIPPRLVYHSIQQRVTDLKVPTTWIIHIYSMPSPENPHFSIVECKSETVKFIQKSNSNTRIYSPPADLNLRLQQHNNLNNWGWIIVSKNEFIGNWEGGSSSSAFWRGIRFFQRASKWPAAGSRHSGTKGPILPQIWCPTCKFIYSHLYVFYVE